MLLLYTENSSCVSNQSSDNVEIRREVFPNLQQKYIHTYTKINDKWVLNGEQKGYYEDGNAAYVYNYIEGIVHGCQKEYSHKLSLPSHRLTETYYFYGLLCTSKDIFKWKTDQLNPNYRAPVGPTGAMGWMGPGYSDYYIPADSEARFIFPLIQNNKTELAKRLIKHTPDLNCNKNGYNLLYYVFSTSAHTDFELVKILLSRNLTISPYQKFNRDLMLYLIDNCPDQLRVHFKGNLFTLFSYDEDVIQLLYNKNIITLDDNILNLIDSLEKYYIIKNLGYILSLTETNMRYLMDRPENLIKVILTDLDSSNVTKFVDFLKCYKSDYDYSDDDYADEEVDYKSALMTKISEWFPNV